MANQRDWVETKLQLGIAINHADLIRECRGRGGWRLGAHIHQLRQSGWPIFSTPLGGNDDAPSMAVEYRLQPGWQPDNRKPQLPLFI